MIADAETALPVWTQWEFIDALGDGVYGVDLEGKLPVRQQGRAAHPRLRRTQTT